MYVHLKMWKARNIRDSLQYENLHFRFKSVEDPSETGSGAWLFQTDLYRFWASQCFPFSKPPFLGLNGKVGSGKSTLTKMAINHESRDKSSQKMLLHFFFDGSQPRQGEPRLSPAMMILGSILEQIISKPRSIPERLLHKYMGRKMETWTVSELKEAIKSILVHHTQGGIEVKIFFDGLDECQERDEITMVLSFFEGLVQHHSPGLNRRAEDSAINIKLFISSQDCHRYGAILPEMDIISVSDSSNNDLSRYIRQELQNLPAGFREKLHVIINDRADGIFLWARLALFDVKDRVTYSTQWEVVTFVQETPGGLTEIYENRIKMLSNTDAKATIRLFQLMLFRRQTFTARQLRHAYAFLNAFDNSKGDLEISEGEFNRALASLPKGRDFESHLRKVLVGLIDFHPSSFCGGGREDMPVHFIHGTTRSYLLEGALANLMNFDSMLDVEKASHFLLLRICLKVIDFDDFEQGAQESPLRSYAAHFWIEHAREKGEYLTDDFELPPPIKICTDKTSRLFKLYKDYRVSSFRPLNLAFEQEDNPVVLLASEGCGSFAMEHAEYCPFCSPQDVEDDEKMNISPETSIMMDRALYFATSHWQVDTVRLFRQSSQYKFNPSRIFRGSSSLYKACYDDQPDILKELLSMGADICKLVPGGYKSGLHAAVAQDYRRIIEVIFSHEQSDPRLLLELAVDFFGGKGFTALHVAALYGRLDAATILLRHIGKMDRPHDFHDQKNAVGKTAAEIAKGKRMRELLETYAILHKRPRRNES